MKSEAIMNYQQFIDSTTSRIPVGVIIKNPGGGTSKIISYSDQTVCYERGKSTISVSFDNLYQAYNQFRGKKVSTKDLRDFAPTVFDSKQNGHSCNATFLFSILKLLGKVSEIKGEGKANHPFYVSINAE